MDQPKVNTLEPDAEKKQHPQLHGVGPDAAEASSTRAQHPRSTVGKNYRKVFCDFTLLFKEILATSLRLNPTYVKVNKTHIIILKIFVMLQLYLTYSNLLINGLLPLTLIIIINTKIYHRFGIISTNH